MKKLVFFTLLLAHCALYPYIFQIQMLVRQRPDGTKQYVHLLNDIHVFQFKNADTYKTALCGQVQRKEFIENIKQLNTSPLVVAEDIYDLALHGIRNPLGNFGKLLIQVLYTSQCFLQNLVETCRLNNVNALNVDYRANNLNLFPKDYSLRLIQKKIDALKTFNDTPELNAYYQEILSQISIDPASLAIKMDKMGIDMNGADFIDAHALHAIIANPTIEHIFVCAGKTHCQNINLRLQGDPGFTLIKEHTISDDLQSAYNNRRYMFAHPEELNRFAKLEYSIISKLLDYCYRQVSIIAPYFAEFIKEHIKKPMPVARL